MFRDNEITNSTSGIIYLGTPLTYFNNLIIQNYIETNESNGVYIDDVDGVVAINNEINSEICLTLADTKDFSIRINDLSAKETGIEYF